MRSLNDQRLIVLAKVGAKLMQMGRRKSKRLSEEEMGKRQPYGFGLGRVPASYCFSFNACIL